jgi:hypothetical protein
MGSKAGFSSVVLRVLGLVPGQRAAAYLWCEPDPGVRLLLEAYRDGALAKAAAAIIRSWAGEDPRALWERLRAEGPPRCPDGGVEAGEVARQLVTGHWAYRRGIPDSGFAESLAGAEIGPVAARLETCSALPATIAPDARQVDPREVARWAAFMVRTMPQAQARGATPGDFLPRVAPSGTVRYQPDAPAQGFMELPTLPALIHPDARAVDPGPALPPGTVAYLDGPYENTTQYANLLPRSEQVTLARRWAAAGATVCISEAEAIPDLVAEGWHAVRIDGERVGQRRTFSKQQAEWLTLNRPPAWRPSVQGGLFTPR